MKNFQSIKQNAVNKFYRCFIRYVVGKSQYKQLKGYKTVGDAIRMYAATEKGKQDLQTIVDNVMNQYLDAQTIINEYVVDEHSMYTATFKEVYDTFCSDVVESTARAQKCYEDFDKWYDHFHEKDSDWVVWATTLLIMFLVFVALFFR
jgi:hypothetical protein